MTRHMSALIFTSAYRLVSLVLGRRPHSLVERMSAAAPAGGALLRVLPACSSRSVSSLAGDGMKPTSEPSFTSLPIHQLLLYFSCGRGKLVLASRGRHVHRPRHMWLARVPHMRSGHGGCGHISHAERLDVEVQQWDLSHAATVRLFPEAFAA